MRDPQDVDVLATGPNAGSRWKNRLPLAVGVAAFVVVVDQLTKRWALETLEAGPCSQTDACIDLIAGARFRLVFNNGAAFATGGDFGPVFGVLAFFMTFLLLYLAAKQSTLRGLVPFAAIAGGAVGNLLDRLFRADDGFLTGAVIDFVDLGWWPVFNVADSAIVVGVIAVIIFTMLEPEPSAEDDGPDGDPVSRQEAFDPDRGEEARTEGNGAGPDGASAVGRPTAGRPTADRPTAGDGGLPDEGEPSLTT